MYSLKESLAVAKNPATNIRYLIDIFIEYHKPKLNAAIKQPETSNRRKLSLPT